MFRNNVTPYDFFYIHKNEQRPKYIRLKEMMQYAFQRNGFELNSSKIMTVP